MEKAATLRKIMYGIASGFVSNTKVYKCEVMTRKVITRAQ